MLNVVSLQSVVPCNQKVLARSVAQHHDQLLVVVWHNVTTQHPEAGHFGHPKLILMSTQTCFALTIHNIHAHFTQAPRRRRDGQHSTEANGSQRHQHQQQA